MGVLNVKLELLKKKIFPLLITGGAISSLGSKMLNIAFSLYVLQITGSATKFASL